MPAARVAIPRVILAVAVAAASVDAALYATAVARLADGPDARGTTLLAAAHVLAAAIAVLAVAFVTARTFSGGRILAPTLVLLIAACATAGLTIAVPGLLAVPLFLAAGAAVLPFVALLRSRRLSLDAV